MTSFRYAALALAFPLASLAGAQITLVSPGNVPVNGRTYIVHRGAYTTPGAGGANMQFNYTSLTGTGVNTYAWQDPASLLNGAQFPEAQFALTNAGPDTVFYKATAAGLERIGDTQTISAGNSYHFTTSFSNSVLELQIPLAYGNAPWTDLFTGTFTVDGNNATRNGAITGKADAWGQLTMPGGGSPVEVLRVATRLTESIPMTVSGIPVTITHVHNASAFYPLWGKFPVLRMVSDSLTSSPININQNYAYTEWLDATAMGIASQEAQPLAMQVFPNPAGDAATVLLHNAANSPVEVAVVDMRGSVVLRKQANGTAVDIDVQQWAPGIYQVVLTNKEGLRSTARLVVAH